MGDVVNLRNARKRKARGERERQAEENRIRFGRTTSEKRQAKSEMRNAASYLDGHRRVRPGSTDHDEAGDADIGGGDRDR